MAQAQQGMEVQRIPPQAPEIEMAVLGAMMLEKEAVYKALEILDETSFYVGKHQKIFEAIVHLF